MRSRELLQQDWLLQPDPIGSYTPLKIIRLAVTRSGERMLEKERATGC